MTCMYPPPHANHGIFGRQAADSDGMMGSFDALLLEPAAAKEAALNKGGPKVPLIAYPHGGPHSNMGQVCL